MTGWMKKFFSKTVDDYDTVDDKVVFKNKELHERLLSAIDIYKEVPLNILDLWSWTWHAIKLILEKFEKSHITGIDFSKKMIQKCMTNIWRTDRVNIIEWDFTKVDFQWQYDIIFSVVSIHNCTDDEKIELFKKIYKSLKDGGIFINADFFKHEVEKLDDKMKCNYKKFLESNLEWEELEAWLYHAFEQDMPMKLSTQFDLLEEIGFQDLSLEWMHNNEAVYVAKK